MADEETDGGTRIDPFTLKPGMSVKGYDLIAPIGSGSMGLVWKVRNSSGVVQAMKFLAYSEMNRALMRQNSPNAGIEARKRFEREAEILKQFHIPSIEHIVDYDIWGNCPFILTDFYDGPTLEQDVASNGPWHMDRVARLGNDLNNTLKVIHDKNIVHRDIKPSNIIVDAVTGMPVLVDFGIAKNLEQPALTVAGLKVCSSQYAAPEIIGSYESKATIESESWALVCVLVFAATGHHAFVGSPSWLYMQIAAGNANLDGLPEQVRDVFRRALNPNPKDRCSIGEVLSALSGSTGDFPRTVSGANRPVKVTFHLSENEKTPWRQELMLRGGRVTRPADTDSLHFREWYKTVNDKWLKPYDFLTPEYADIDLYADFDALKGNENPTLDLPALPVSTADTVVMSDASVDESDGGLGTLLQSKRDKLYDRQPFEPQSGEEEQAAQSVSQHGETAQHNEDNNDKDEGQKQMSRFDFLQERFPKLAELGNLAEEYASSDPDSAGTKLRQYAEGVGKAVFDQIHLPYPVDSRIKGKTNPTAGSYEHWFKTHSYFLKRKKFLDSDGDLLQIFKNLVGRGNDASHEAGHIDSQQAGSLVRQAETLGMWLFNNIDDLKSPEQDPDALMRVTFRFYKDREESLNVRYKEKIAESEFETRGRSGYVWLTYTASHTKKEFDHETLIEEDITLHGKRVKHSSDSKSYPIKRQKAKPADKPRTITVGFHTFDGDSQPPASQSVTAGGQVAKPADPKREGYSFTGWYEDRACNRGVSFPLLPKTDIEIWGGWARDGQADDETSIPDKLTGESLFEYVFGSVEEEAIELIRKGSW